MRHQLLVYADDVNLRICCAAVLVVCVWCCFVFLVHKIHTNELAAHSLGHENRGNM
jgi:hypothetical protein